MRELPELIAQAPLLAGLAPAHLALLAGCGQLQRVEAGARLLQVGAPADRFYLIRGGDVALELPAPGQPPLVVLTLHEHDIVGWSWLFAPFRWREDARALTDCALVGFDAACLRTKCDADHELGYQLMRRFAAALGELLDDTRLQLLDVYGHAAVTG